MADFKTKLYFSTEENFFENLKKLLGNDLLFYCVTGGLARNEVIPGWSDIDTLIVCSQLDIKTITGIKESLSKNDSNIKIGTTFYSLEEFNSYKFQDPKTFNIIRNIQKNRYKPRIYNKRVYLRNIDNELINDINKIQFTKDLHSFKRELIKYPDYSERDIYRFLTYMLRVLLFCNNVYPDGYKETWIEAERILANLPLKNILPEQIMNFTENRHERFLSYVEFLNWLKKNDIFINNKLGYERMAK